jgi:hypothetical protein
MGRIIETIQTFRRQLHDRNGVEAYGIRIGMDEWAELSNELAATHPHGKAPEYSPDMKFMGLWLRRTDRLNELVVHGDNHAGPAHGVGYGDLAAAPLQANKPRRRSGENPAKTVSGP